jgi:nucleoside-diphosphate-sugar epimerase
MQFHLNGTESRLSPSVNHLESEMGSKSSVLVLGATGGIGGEVARQLRDAGWDVRALRRRASQPIEPRDGMTWVRGDAMKAEDVRAAAQGCSVLVHAVNPPGLPRKEALSPATKPGHSTGGYFSP